MKKNMGTVDKIIRVLIAIVLLILFFTGNITGTLGIILFALSIILIITSFISFCPLYLPFGLSTVSKPKQ
jgi:hypothetical protein